MVIADLSLNARCAAGTLADAKSAITVGMGVANEEWRRPNGGYIGRIDVLVSATAGT